MGNAERHLIRPGYVSTHKKYFSKIETPFIYAYVEDYADINFWSQIFDTYSSITIVPTTNDGSADGKNALFKISSYTGKDRIVCVDSDLDYLLPTRSDIANMINTNICVFHTYTYSTENYHCFSQSLDSLCKRISKHHHPDDQFDFEKFLSDLSCRIYEPFLYILCYMLNNHHRDRLWKQFKRTIALDESKLRKAKSTSKLRRVVQEMLDDMECRLIGLIIDSKIIEYDISLIMKSLEDKKVKRSMAYLFICGHTLLDHVVTPIAKQVIAIHRKIELLRIQMRYKEHPIQYKNKVQEYINLSRGSQIGEQLMNNYEFHGCYLIQEIKRDIKVFMQEYYPDFLVP